MVFVQAHTVSARTPNNGYTDVPMVSVARRLELTLELAELGVEIYETRIRRERPDLSDARVAQVVAEWRRTRPGAELGDAEGRAIDWPRRERTIG